VSLGVCVVTNRVSTTGAASAGRSLATSGAGLLSARGRLTAAAGLRLAAAATTAGDVIFAGIIAATLDFSCNNA